jgi:hypothetical protein
MEVSRQDLAERFQTLPDDVLMKRVHAGTLTPLALEVALDELRSRGVEVTPGTAALAASETGDLTPEERAELPDSNPDADLVTIARYSNPLEANVLRSCLESQGVFAFLWGEHLGTANVFLSVISGGIRLQVRRDQVEKAKEVIAAFERGDFAIDEEPE